MTAAQFGNYIPSLLFLKPPQNGDSQAKEQPQSPPPAASRLPRPPLVVHSGRHVDSVLALGPGFAPESLARCTRTDGIPETEEDETGQLPVVRDYHSINAVPPLVRFPKKIATTDVIARNFAYLCAFISVCVLSLDLAGLRLHAISASHHKIASQKYGNKIQSISLSWLGGPKTSSENPMILGPVVISA
ncbi:hypothetical protein C8R43DRAFT_1202229 [Mycena crocata]|nr:hypothetical protein C8R43DRAFT_1202229 [Mycena crocata]